MEKEKFQAMVVNVYENMNNIFLDEENKNIVEMIEGEIDETFFIAEVIALRLQFQKLTGIDQDLIDFIGTLNKLVFQYMLELQKEEN